MTYQWFDLRAAFLLGGLGSLTAALIILFALKENSQPPDPDPSTHRIATLEILSNRRVLMPCISCFSYMIGITAFSSLAAIPQALSSRKSRRLNQPFASIEHCSKH